MSVILLQTPPSRAINVGYILNNKFIPGRLNFGVQRIQHTYQATIDSLSLPEIIKILGSYTENKISTVTIMREGLACNKEIIFICPIASNIGIEKISNFLSKQKIKTTFRKSNCPPGGWTDQDT